MEVYTFPFSTCERHCKNGIAQPFSSAVNIIIVLFLIYCLFQAKSPQLKYVFFSFILFELWHTMSHMIFIAGNIQQSVVHFLAYNIAFGTLFALLYLSKSSLNVYQITLLAIVVLFDIFIYLNYGGVYMILSGTLIFIAILLCVYSKYSTFISYYIIGLIVLALLFVNEAVNCKWMLQYWPNFPFHIIIELYGLLLFYVLSSKLLSLQKTI